MTWNTDKEWIFCCVILILMLRLTWAGVEPRSAGWQSYVTTILSSLLIMMKIVVGSIFCFIGWVSPLWIGFGKLPLKIQNFSVFFSSGQKKFLRVESKSTRIKVRLASYLLWVESMLRSGRVRSGPISTGLQKNQQDILNLGNDNLQWP